MTRAEAIEVVKRIKDKCNDELHGVRYVTDKEALDMAIDALEQNESAEKWYKLFVKKLDEQEPCDTSIEQALLLEVIDKFLPTECEDAISRVLERMWNCRGKNATSIDKVKMEQIIREELSVQQKPIECDDAISREAAIKQAKASYRVAESFEELANLYEENLKSLPSVQPSRKGHWIEVAQYSDGKHKIECSECGNYIFDRGHANSKNVKEKYKYCNYCGADMRGDTE